MFIVRLLFYAKYADSKERADFDVETHLTKPSPYLVRQCELSGLKSRIEKAENRRNRRFSTLKNINSEFTITL